MLSWCFLVRDWHKGKKKKRNSAQYKEKLSCLTIIGLPTTFGEGNGNPLQNSCLEIPWMEEPGRLQSMVLWRVGHDWATSLSLFTFMHWRRKWKPTPVLLPGESQEWEPGGLPSMGSHRVGHDWSDLAATAVTFTCNEWLDESSTSHPWKV